MNINAPIIHSIRLTAIFFYCFIISTAVISQTEICEGNLGANIFENGDFGSGAAAILQNDPGYAPGYIYQNNPPPQDGFYTVTNNTGFWNGLFGTWRVFQDNSPDPLGYMLLANGSYTQELFYDQIVEGLCENTLYEFSADITNVIRKGIANQIFPNVSFLINEQIIINSGDIPQDEEWHTYGFTFVTEIGQSSIRLGLRNNAPGGIGNDLALDNISFRACGPEALILPMEVADICEDGSPIELNATINGTQFDNPAVQWQRSNDEGVTWNLLDGETGMTYIHTELSSGFYYYRFLIAGDEANIQNPKCQIISNIKVVHVVPREYLIIDSLCEGLSFQFGENELSETGVYQESFISSIGCDSIVTVELQIVTDSGIKATLEKQDISCHDSEDGLVKVLSISSPFSLTNISLTDSNGEDINNYSKLKTGDYLYKISDRYGCIYEELINIGSPTPFVIDLGSDRNIFLGDEVIITPASNYAISNYNWQPVNYFDCSIIDCSSPLFYPTKTDTIYMNAESELGCLDTDFLIINVDKTVRAYVPNAFSPNNDAINDQFTVFSHKKNVKLIESLSIFNRWGSKVFERNNFPPNEQSLGWDGTINGKNAPEGTYVYQATIRILDESVEIISGEFSLLR